MAQMWKKLVCAIGKNEFIPAGFFHFGINRPTLIKSKQNVQRTKIQLINNQHHLIRFLEHA